MKDNRIHYDLERKLRRYAIGNLGEVCVIRICQLDSHVFQNVVKTVNTLLICEFWKLEGIDLYAAGIIQRVDELLFFFVA